ENHRADPERRKNPYRSEVKRASSNELQHRADRARERLSEPLNHLSIELSPSAVIGDLLRIDYDKARQDVTQFLSKHVRGNALAFALIAAGVGWVLSSEAGEARSRHT